MITDSIFFFPLVLVEQHWLHRVYFSFISELTSRVPQGVIESPNPKFSFYGDTNECARANTLLVPIAEVCAGPYFLTTYYSYYWYYHSIVTTILQLLQLLELLHYYNTTVATVTRVTTLLQLL